MMQVSEGRRAATLAAVFVPAAVAGLAPRSARAAEQATEDAATAEVRALLAAHDKAFTAHDLDGLLKTFSPKAAVVGTGPGELWVGRDEITVAYRHFFEGFDVGKQSFQYLWRQGHVGADTAWLTTLTRVSMTKAGQAAEFGLNLSLVAEKIDGHWSISSLHFSNLTPCPASEVAK